MVVDSGWAGMEAGALCSKWLVSSVVEGSGGGGGAGSMVREGGAVHAAHWAGGGSGRTEEVWVGIETMTALFPSYDEDQDVQSRMLILVDIETGFFQ